MKLAVLHPSYEGSCSPFKDLESEFDPARYLEQLNVAFTGAGSAFYDPSRVAMKMAWPELHGLQVPATRRPGPTR